MTRQGSKSSKVQEIEVTDEMIAVGVEVLWNFEGELSKAMLAEEVYRAMAEQARMPGQKYIYVPRLGARAGS